MRNIISILFCLFIGIANSLCAVNYKGDKTRKEVTSLSKEQESPMLLSEPHYDVQQDDDYYDGTPMPRHFGELHNARARTGDDEALRVHLFYDMPIPRDYNDVVSQESKGNVVPVDPVVSKEKENLQNHEKMNRSETKKVDKKHYPKKNKKTKKKSLSHYKRKGAGNDFGLYNAINTGEIEKVRQILSVYQEALDADNLSDAFVLTSRWRGKNKFRLKIAEIFLEYSVIQEKLSEEVLDRVVIRCIYDNKSNFLFKILREPLLRAKLYKSTYLKCFFDGALRYAAKKSYLSLKQILSHEDLRQRLSRAVKVDILGLKIRTKKVAENNKEIVALLRHELENGIYGQSDEQNCDQIPSVFDYHEIVSRFESKSKDTKKKKIKRISCYVRKGTGNDFGLYYAVDAGESEKVQQILKTYRGQLSEGNLSDAFHRSMSMNHKKDLCQKIAEMFLEYSDVKEKLSKEVLDRVVMKAINKRSQDLFFKIVRDPVLRAKLYRRSDTRGHFDVALIRACKRCTYFLKEILSHNDLRERLSRTVKIDILNEKKKVQRLKQNREIVALLQHDLENGIYGQQAEASGNTQETQQNVDAQLHSAAPSQIKFLDRLQEETPRQQEQRTVCSLLDAVKTKGIESVRKILFYGDFNGLSRGEIIEAFVQTMQGKEKEDLSPEKAKVFLGHSMVKELLSGDVLDFALVKSMYYDFKPLFSTIIQDRVLRAKLYKNKATKEKIDNALRHVLHDEYYMKKIMQCSRLRKRLSVAIKHDILKRQAMAEVFWGGNCDVLDLLLHDVEYRTVLEKEIEPLSKILYFINETFMKRSQEAQKTVDMVMKTFCKHMDLEKRIVAICEEQDFTFILTQFNDE